MWIIERYLCIKPGYAAWSVYEPYRAAGYVSEQFLYPVLAGFLLIRMGIPKTIRA